MNKAVFFDRDGIITDFIYDLETETINPPLKPEQVNLTYYIVELLKQIKALGYLNIIISNRPDIALGKTTPEGLEKVREEIHSQLTQNGAVIDDEFYCMHHPFAKIEEYKKICECRKPETGLILEAAKKYDIDLSKSWMIGDGINDIKAGEEAGLKTVLLANTGESGYLSVLEDNLGKTRPDFLVKNLKEISEIIKA